MRHLVLSTNLLRYTRAMSAFLLPGFYAVLQLLIVIAVGVVARRSGTWSDDFFTGLSRFVVRIALPLYFVERLAQTDFSNLGEIFLMPLAAAIVIGLGLTLGSAFFALSRYTGVHRRAGVAMSGFGNSGYMPLTFAEVLPTAIPGVVAVFNTDLVPVLIAAYVLVFSPLLWSVGNYVITRGDDHGRRLRVRELLSPPLIGILAGTALSLLGAPSLLRRPELPFVHIFGALERLSAITLPLALVNLGALIGGLALPPGSIRHYLGVAVRVILVRYAVLPGIFFALLATGALGSFAPAVVLTLFLEMHTPPATNFSLMVGQAGVNTEHTAVTLLLSYIAYLVVMPVAIVLLLSFYSVG